jgi:hypothetical protein
MLPWVMESRIAGGQEMTYGRSLGRYLKHFGQARAGGSAPAFTEWATLAQDRAGWRKLLTAFGKTGLRRRQAARTAAPVRH